MNHEIKVLDAAYSFVLAVLAVITTIAVCCMLLCGCSTPTPIYTHDYEGAWTEAQKADVEAGFALWPKQISGDLMLVLVDGSDDRCPAERVSAHASLNGHAAGHTICFYPDAIARHNVTFVQVAAHEYGHVLGLRFEGSDPQHYTGTEPSLMTPSSNHQASTPQPVDLAAIP